MLIFLLLIMTLVQVNLTKQIELKLLMTVAKDNLKLKQKEKLATEKENETIDFQNEKTKITE